LLNQPATDSAFDYPRGALASSFTPKLKKIKKIFSLT